MRSHLSFGLIIFFSVLQVPCSSFCKLLCQHGEDLLLTVVSTYLSFCLTELSWANQTCTRCQHLCMVNMWGILPCLNISYQILHLLLHALLYLCVWKDKIFSLDIFSATYLVSDTINIHFVFSWTMSCSFDMLFAHLCYQICQGIPPVNKHLNDEDGWIIVTAKKLSDWWSWVCCQFAWLGLFP